MVYLGGWGIPHDVKKTERLKNKQSKKISLPKPVLKEKQCTNCNKIKPLHEYHLRKEHRTGYAPHCKQCDKERYVAKKIRNNEFIHIINETGRTCRKCKQFKKWEGYWQSSKSKTGYRARCKSCMPNNTRQYKALNEEQRKQQRTKAYQEKVKANEAYIQFYQQNKNQVDAYRDNYIVMSDDFLQQFKRENKESIDRHLFVKKESRNKRNARRRREREKTDPVFRVASIVRRYIRGRIKAKQHKTIKYLGCNFEFYKRYIEGMFEPGMTWDNYPLWHIDHIVPVSWFDLTNNRCVLNAFNYKNTKPMWASENLKKGNKSTA